MELPEIDTDPVEKLDPTQDLVIVGEKKEWNPIEEFWMEKLSKVEEQYEAHMVNLERALLESKIHRRLVCRQDEQLTSVSKQYREKAKEAEQFKKKASTLKGELSTQQKEKNKLEGKLASAVTKFMQTDSQAKAQRSELRKCNREILALRKKLAQLEKEKKLLSHDIKIKENENARYAERETDLWKKKTMLLRNLKAVDAERQGMQSLALKLNSNIANVLEDATLRDRKILLLRREIEDILLTMKKQKVALTGELNQKNNLEKKLCDTKEKLEETHFKLDDLNMQVLSWKEEAMYKEVAKIKENLELKKVKSENRMLRSQLAELTHSHNKTQSELKALETQRDRMQIELRKMKAQDVVIQNLMKQNAFQKLKISRKIPQLPSINESTAGKSRTMENDLHGFSRSCPATQIEGYTKKIWELERNLHEVESKIDEGRRRENSYRIRLQRFDALKEQLFWTQKAMLRLEADKKGMEQMIQSFAKTMPRKIPFEKLVTDPSILDRIAKQKVLQKRLQNQTTKVEHLKEITMQLLQNEERRRAESLSGPRKPETYQPWQLNYWKQQGSDLTEIPVSETKAGYYKDYMGFLGQEIPRLKSELIQLERKKQHLRSLRPASQSRSASVVDLDAEDYTPDDVSDELEDEDEEEEEEEEEQEEEGTEGEVPE